MNAQIKAEYTQFTEDCQSTNEMLTESLRKDYEAHVKQAVRDGMLPQTPNVFFENALQSFRPAVPEKKANFVPWHKTPEQEATFAKFQDIMARNDICHNGVNVMLKHRFENGEFK